MSQSLYKGVEEKLSLDYLYGNFSRVRFLCIYLAASIALFIFVLVEQIEGHLNWLQVIARICGMQLNLNSTLMLVLMLRHIARLIRSSRFLYAIVLVDDAVAIHAVIGRWIAVLSFIHAICHMIYYSINRHGRYIFIYQKK
jgi:hypothetical protein